MNDHIADARELLCFGAEGATEEVTGDIEPVASANESMVFRGVNDRGFALSSSSSSTCGMISSSSMISGAVAASKELW